MRMLTLAVRDKGSTRRAFPIFFHRNDALYAYLDLKFSFKATLLLKHTISGSVSRIG